MSDRDALYVRLRACWVRRDNLRVSAEGDADPWAVPAYRALVLESIRVHESERRQGVCRRFIEEMTRQPGYDLFVVEAVQNPVLADALMRWGWEFDSGVMDFYKFAAEPTR